jgi:hypothetical protein
VHYDDAAVDQRITTVHGLPAADAGAWHTQSAMTTTVQEMRLENHIDILK